MSEENKDVHTTVDTISVEDIDALFDGVTSSDSIMISTPEKEKEKVKPSIFSKDKISLEFLDDDEEEEDSNIVEDTTKVLDNLEVNNDTSEEVTQKSKGGRPTVDKKGMAGLVSKLIESNYLVPFQDDEKPLEEYTLDDYEELITENFKHKEETLRDEISTEFFDNLPPKMQAAAAYIANGGRDLEAMFATLARSESIEKLDPEEPDHQERIIRNYLEAKGFGTPEEIEEEIEVIKDNNRLESKAKQFKPKLDDMQEEIIQGKLAQQENMRRKQEQSASRYADSVFKALEAGKLGEIKIDPRTQNMLYKGLVQATYTSISGKNTNMLGHLLEKYQFSEPNHELIAEVLYHLADPKGFKDQLAKATKKDVVSKTVRELKGEQSNRQASGSTEDAFTRNESRTPGIKRQNKTFFQR